MNPDIERRFGGISRLYGLPAYTAFQRAHLCVIGIGGVGSWAAEALARSAIGRITLIDLDMVAESNTNRQIHALGDEYGKAKVEAMAHRIRAINPDCDVRTIEDFVTPENIADIVNAGLDGVIDAIDQARSKAPLIAHCRTQKIPLVTVGAAGGQIDPTQIRCADLSATEQDPLLAKVRSQLRRDFEFPRKGKFDIPAIYSLEPLRYPPSEISCNAEANGPQGLSCAGFGSSVCVTASMGLAAAAHLLSHLAANHAAFEAIPKS